MFTQQQQHSLLGVLPQGAGRFVSRRCGPLLVALLLLWALLGTHRWDLHPGVNPARDQERAARYNTMQASFRKRGLDVASIDAQRAAMWETTASSGGGGTDNLLLPPGPPRALPFKATGTGVGAERFVALRLPLHVAKLADEAAGQVLQSLASSRSEMRAYRTPASAMHSTLFFHARQDGSGRAGSEAVWHEESDWWREQATSATSSSVIPEQSVRLRVEGLMLAPS